MLLAWNKDEMNSFFNNWLCVLNQIFIPSIFVLPSHRILPHLRSPFEAPLLCNCMGKDLNGSQLEVFQLRLQKLHTGVMLTLQSRIMLVPVNKFN
jgi:hypothetical protein